MDKVLIAKTDVRTRNNGNKLDEFRFRKEISRKWFTNKVANEWKKLSQFVVVADTTESF